MGGCCCCCSCNAQKREDESYDPSPFTLCFGTSDKSEYVSQKYEKLYEGHKSILVICTDEGKMEMKNGNVFNTGNHPIEMLVPMLHFRDAGFTFDIATEHGNAVVLEEWAYPNKDENVKNLHDSVRSMMENPKQLSSIENLDAYVAVFIPGGHGAMVNLPFSIDLGRLLHEAHENKIPTVTLCHGPATLLSSNKVQGKDFAYEGYEIMCFTDKTDAFTPSLGYLPGEMPWKCQEALEKEGVKVLNTSETGAVTQYEEVFTGDGPGAAHNLGVFAAPILVKMSMESTN